MLINGFAKWYGNIPVSLRKVIFGLIALVYVLSAHQYFNLNDPQAAFDFWFWANVFYTFIFGFGAYAHRKVKG